MEERIRDISLWLMVTLKKEDISLGSGWAVTVSKGYLNSAGWIQPPGCQARERSISLDGTGRVSLMDLKQLGVQRILSHEDFCNLGIKNFGWELLKRLNSMCSLCWWGGHFLLCIQNQTPFHLISTQVLVIVEVFRVGGFSVTLLGLCLLCDCGQITEPPLAFALVQGVWWCDYLPHTWRVRITWVLVKCFQECLATVLTQ